MTQRFKSIVFFAVLAGTGIGVSQAMAAPASTETMVAMRDGVRLATSVALPEGAGPWPAVLTRTPYNKEGFIKGSLRYTKAGYAYVAQDCRGKYRSEGAYVPFENDMEDGYDTVEWVGEQSFCNGKVGMSGASAMGITSNLAAAANPDHLVTAFVVVAPQSSFNESTFIGGVFKEADVGTWMQKQGAGDQVAGIKKRVVMDDRWKKRDLVHHLDKIDIPIYNVGGWYDIFSKGSVSNFVYLQNKGAPGAQGRQKLLMGPFGHGQLSGDLKYESDQGLTAVFKEELRWFDHWLKGAKNGIVDEPAVKYYQMAAARKDKFSRKNGYRTAKNWPPAHRKVRYYLRDDFGLSRDAPTGKSGTTRYVADPANPVKTVGGANLTIARGPMDQRDIKDRSDYLRFQTGLLKEDLSIAGPVELDLYASTDGLDTDFMVKLVDVYPDGYEALVLDCPLRARYRGGRNPGDVKMMEPGQVTRMRIDLWNTAITFEKGHRLAVHISSSNSPRFEVNPNTGEAPGEAKQSPRVAHNTIYHDAAHPTALVLPVTSN